MENYLNKIVNKLKEIPLYLDASNEDGRINSINNEATVIDFLKKYFNEIIEQPAIRQWFDFKIKEKNEELFVNIKVSDLNNPAADNVSSKLGMGYALTGIKNMPMVWEKFHEMLIQELKIGYDYYFLIVNKNNSQDSYWTSLKRIQTLVANGNNLPFQCDWTKNKKFSTRSELDAMRYILSIYVLSWDKKAKGYPFKIKELLENEKLLDSE